MGVCLVLQEGASLLFFFFFFSVDFRTGKKMVSYAPPEFSEELFAVMLESCTPSRSRVEALTQVALRHLTQATDTWSALRKALVRQQDLESDENKGLWYLLDSLMKHAPHVFVPLISPRLHDYVVQQMPWHLVGVVSTLGSGALWCDAMILTWESILPPHLMRNVKSFVVQLRSGKELTNAMNLSGDTDEVQSVDAPASREQIQQLREAWEVFFSFVAEGVRASNNTPAASTTSGALPLAQVKCETTPFAGLKREEGTQPAGADDDDSDVEYVPEFVRGAQHRPLPSLTGDNTTTQKTRRAARRRPREED
ncbi:hypothetical protein, conserved [Trypanosoma cruzi]|uniref:Uncharacterized protein n=2 Tax=Trypanosoma cruzi TaxID=5693 RepID=Q4DI11_TRYCC|nr:hypothetical protein, conserved [Trypanosoma cruzi]EAN92149.1 hypothetical protein, conserved [Trypanosoma cruzi]|eukprot:XP_814000.1 hypothetical protein [Trypanosoma cruzi strain CL Brener]